MRSKRTSIVFGVTGIVLIALAGIERIAVVPSVTKLPGDTDLKVGYSGTATLLDAKALQSGDAAHALATGVPITIDRRIRVQSTHGDVAIVADDVTIHAGATNLPESYVYAVDRGTMQATTAPAGTKAEPATGLTISFPLSPKKDDSYRYYDPMTRSTGVIHYKGTDKRQGHTVGVYSVTITGPLKNAATLATLPPALPKSLVAALAPLLPADVAAKLGPALPVLPDPVPLAYTAMTSIDAYVDPTTGVAVDQHLRQQIIAGVSAGGPTTNLLPVLAIDASVTPASQQTLLNKSNTAATQLTLLKVAAPVALLLLGLLALAFAAFQRQRRRTHPTADDTSVPETQEAKG